MLTGDFLGFILHSLPVKHLLAAEHPLPALPKPIPAARLNAIPFWALQFTAGCG